MTDVFEDSAYEDAPNRMPQTTQVRGASISVEI